MCKTYSIQFQYIIIEVNIEMAHKGHTRLLGCFTLVIFLHRAIQIWLVFVGRSIYLQYIYNILFIYLGSYDHLQKYILKTYRIIQVDLGHSHAP